MTMAHATSSPKAWVERARTVLSSVMKHPLAIAYFNFPVDPVALNLPDYFTIIKCPMDLGTVTKRLAGGAYPNPQVMLSNVRLVWDNCRAYNDPSSEVCAAAFTLETQFEAAWVAAGLGAPRQHHAYASTGAAAGSAHATAAGGLAPPLMPAKKKVPKAAPPSAGLGSAAAALLAGGAASTAAHAGGAAGAPVAAAGPGRPAHRPWGPRCEACISARRGQCGTDTAPKRCKWRRAAGQ